MRRAKIVCTLGPASNTQEMMEKLIAAGMDVARLNFSHGSHADHLAVIERLRVAQLNARKAVGTLADLQGPKIRTGKLKEGAVELVEGRQLSITTDETWLGTQDLVSTTYAHLAEDVNPGDRILLDDGLLELKVLTTDKKQVVTTEVVHGGTLKNNKGINLPGVAIKAAALTPKDREDLIFALQAGVDMVALSFVRRPEDVLECRQAMREAGRVVPIIAKLEKPEAIARLEEILAVTDGVMVARGDLGVEMPPEEVPAIQKEIVRKAAARGLPCIVATQMLNSMIEHPRPTRAEANDVANAIFDNTDAVMLSGESASGRYPVESVEMMTRIVESAEAAMRKAPRPPPVPPLTAPATFQDVMCSAACRSAQEMGATLIVAFTLTGTTARLLSRYRPGTPIVAFSPNQEVRRRMALHWGVTPRVLEPMQEMEEMVHRVEAELLARGMVKVGDRIAIVFGAPVGYAGNTNTLRLHTVAA